MTAINQDFEINNGDDYTVILNAFSDNGKKLDLTLCTFVWTLHVPSPLIKTSGIVNGNILSFPLNGGETKGLSGAFNHDLKIVDQFGKTSTLTKGTVTID